MCRFFSNPSYGFSKQLSVLPFLFILILLCGPISAMADSERMAEHYKVYSADKRCMAATFPDWDRLIDVENRKIVPNPEGERTEVYVLGLNGNKTLKAKLNEYAHSMYVRCYQKHDGKTSVLLIRGHGWPRGTRASDSVNAYSFYLDGKLMNRYSTLDIALFPANVAPFLSHHSIQKKQPEINIGPDGQEVFQVFTVDGRTVSFDLPSGRITRHLKNNVTQQALFDAVEMGDINGINTAIKKGADIHDWYKDGYARPFGWTPLRWALHKKQEAAARFLIKQGADVNAKSFDGIFKFTEAEMKNWKHQKSNDTYWNPDKLFLNNAFHPKWVEPMSRAFKELTRKETLRRHEGRTPLHDVLSSDTNFDSFPRKECGDTEAVRLLLESGADFHGASMTGRKPIHSAVSCSNFDAVHLLLKHGAHLNSRDSRENTPLHLAVVHVIPKMVPFLLNKGADPNLSSKDGGDAVTLCCALRLRRRERKA